jgi:hypothetical protein
MAGICNLVATKPLKDYAARGPFDDIDTPFSATDYLIPSLRRLDQQFYENLVIWESAIPRDRPSTLGQRLKRHGFTVLGRSRDFFTVLPAFSYDIIVTNPPFSLKEKWVAHTMTFGKSWALLLPIAALGVRRSNLNVFLSECQVILPPRRIDFTGKLSPWQYVAWFTHGFNLPGGQIIPVDDQGNDVRENTRAN